MINFAKLTAKGSNLLAEAFEVVTGVCQGDRLSPLLFNIALNDVLQKVEANELKKYG